MLSTSPLTSADREESIGGKRGGVKGGRGKALATSFCVLLNFGGSWRLCSSLTGLVEYPLLDTLCSIMSTAGEVSAAAGVPREDHDPFEVLRNANTVLLHNLRRDEVSPELQKQLTTTGMAPSSQAYFCDPYTNSYLGPQVY